MGKMRRTKAQREASMRNIKKAQAARRKRKTHEKRHKRKFR